MCWGDFCVVHDNKTKDFYYVRVGNIQGVTECAAMKMTLTNVVAFECTPTRYKADLVEATEMPNMVGHQLIPLCDMNGGEEIFGVLAVNGQIDLPPVDNSSRKKPPPRKLTLG
jgi:hypothetical protein